MNANIFDPVKLSTEENLFLQETLGLPPIVALASKPAGVNINAVKPILDHVYALLEREKHTGEKWIGVDAIKGSIATYLTVSERWRHDKRRGAPRFPSMSSYDSKGRPHLNGPGSDSAQVSTYFAADGTRKHFALEYEPSGQASWVAEWAIKAADSDQPSAGLHINRELNRFECFCGHTEKFNGESRASFNAARARISKHLRSDSKQEFVEQHRELHTAEFGQAK